MAPPSITNQFDIECVDNINQKSGAGATDDVVDKNKDIHSGVDDNNVADDVIDGTATATTATERQQRFDWEQPEAQGLYDPQNEHDACGVGFIVAIDGRRSHKVNIY